MVAEWAGPAPDVVLTAANTETVIGHVNDGAADLGFIEPAVADDLAAGRLIETRTPGLDLRRALRAIWPGTPVPPAGPARDLVAHISGRSPIR